MWYVACPVGPARVSRAMKGLLFGAFGLESNKVSRSELLLPSGPSDLWGRGKGKPNMSDPILGSGLGRENKVSNTTGGT